MISLSESVEICVWCQVNDHIDHAERDCMVLRRELTENLQGNGKRISGLYPLEAKMTTHSNTESPDKGINKRPTG
jgi:hypothetical protein